MNEEQQPAAPVWRPNKGPQTDFLATGAYEALYGGAAGGGKSEALLMAALRNIHHAGYRGLLLRRTFPELKRSLIERSFHWYGIAGGRPIMSGQPQWRFGPATAIEFGHVQREEDVHDYQSAEYQFIGFDELTHFTKNQYVYMLSRARSSKGIPVRIRAATNPGGEGHDWVYERWGRWLNPRHPLPLNSSEVGWYVNDSDGERWLTRDEAKAINAAWDVATPDARRDMQRALSRVFIGADVRDNPHLMDNDPEYVQRLMGLDALSRAQLLDGNWLARAARGVLFKRPWFGFADSVPWDAKYIRCWDRAGTAEQVNVRVGGKKPNSDPDWTAGVKLARHGADWIVVDVKRFRARPRDVKKEILDTAQADTTSCGIALWQDPGQAGKYEVEDYVAALAGYPVMVMPQSKDKVTYAKPVSAQAEARNIKIMRGDWNEAFLQELEEFPEGNHDDQVDALSGAFKAHVEGIAPSYDEYTASGSGRRM